MNRKIEYLFPDSEIMIFTKAPEIGESKTRIAQTTGLELAASFSGRLIEHAVKTVVDASLAPVSIWVADKPDHPFIQSLISNYPLSVFPQTDGTLGDRMSNALDTRLASKHSVVLIGSDCPFINRPYLLSTLTQLKHDRDIVIGPAEDGGYVLIGLRKNDKRLFENIAWSQDSVMQQTRKQVDQCGYRLFELDMLSDIDYFEDIQRWQPLITSVPALQEWLQNSGETDG
ncbi:MAG: TIGR04282 family arsenosugar biosynthesis glycosyltransferase [Gammaproteobacteria bacterium]